MAKSTFREKSSNRLYKECKKCGRFQECSASFFRVTPYDCPVLKKRMKKDLHPSEIKIAYPKSEIPDKIREYTIKNDGDDSTFPPQIKKMKIMKTIKIG